MKKYVSVEELRKVAEQISKTIVICTQDDCGSHDVRKHTTKEQKQIIYDLAYGALHALRYYCRKCKDGYAAGAWETIGATEFQCDIMLNRTLKPGEECNGYDTIYLPLMKAFAEWEEET